ncbi:hypothetical protein A1O1_07748 [Capronia coronata CBS 617.96]|uniref:Uncharacterized protein n=1 Tax=Capronia coronata CBS 617.96 TaxID=1182541 RepID=W9XN78_9EURO|nr:uncharacterized protein A1O1_07748 [Capronia coronata CBS 617.96]EXJ81683.1 hypothetical protein A1O1_07748 [Capronia coronata CBS 617.96]
MASHERSRSRGSFSIFSFDTIRSLSRAGSRQGQWEPTFLSIADPIIAVRIPSRAEPPDRSESKLSCRCDPQDQPPASPGPDSITEVVSAAPRATSPEGEHTPDERDNMDPPEILVHKRGDSHRTAPRARRLSWLPFGRSSSQKQHPRSPSVYLPKATSASTVARSVISAPVLTSTTNAKVARVEGVYCREISDLGFAPPAGNSQGERANPPTQQSNGHPANAGGLQNASVKRGRMLRLGDAVKSKFKGPVLRRQSEKSLRPAMANGTDEPSTLTMENGIARRRTEAFNLYKGKIKELTGSGNIRRKPVNNSKAFGAHPDPPSLRNMTDHLLADESAEQSDNDSAFGSLTRSFASAVDKLDFSSSLAHNMPFLRSRSSFFNSKKDKDSGEQSEARRQVSGASSLLRSPSASLSSPSTMTLPKKTLDRSPSGQNAQDDHPGESSPSASLVFDSRNNAYLPYKPIDGDIERRHPLRMNPSNRMAVPPVKSLQSRQANQLMDDQSPIPRQQRTKIPVRQSDDEDEDETLSLDDAPIYSPSLGDLSQYARDTPPSKATCKPGALGDKTAGVTPDPTPTRNNQSSGQQRSVLKKSRSGIGLFSRSKSVKKLTKTNSRAERSDDPDTSGPSTPSPLHQRDMTRSDSTGKTVKKSRSLHFGGLFKRPSEPDLGAAIPRDLSVPFQPATPSPLRNVTRARGNDGKIHSLAQNRRSASGP